MLHAKLAQACFCDAVAMLVGVQQRNGGENLLRNVVFLTAGVNRGVAARSYTNRCTAK